MRQTWDISQHCRTFHWRQILSQVNLCFPVIFLEASFVVTLGLHVYQMFTWSLPISFSDQDFHKILHIYSFLNDFYAYLVWFPGCDQSRGAHIRKRSIDWRSSTKDCKKISPNQVGMTAVPVISARILHHLKCSIYQVFQVELPRSDIGRTAVDGVISICFKPDAFWDRVRLEWSSAQVVASLVPVAGGLALELSVFSPALALEVKP